MIIKLVLSLKYSFQNLQLKNTYLLVLSDGVSEGNETGLEFFWREAAGVGLVEVIERGPELVELLLGDSLGIACQNLVLHLVDRPVDRGDELFPAHAQSLHRVLSVAVFEDEGFLNLLVDALKFLQVRLELINSILVLTQPRQLLLQRALERRRRKRILDRLPCMPRPNHVFIPACPSQWQKQHPFGARSKDRPGWTCQRTASSEPRCSAASSVRLAGFGLAVAPGSSLRSISS